MKRFTGTIILLALSAAPSCAQFNSRIEGTVNDPAQAGIPGAGITLVNDSTQVTKRTLSSENGFFRISELPPGSYR